ncbi:arginine repressor [Tessaracoccus sp. MC1865]|uniref:arginine repressor n=1 Tax=Tessaracoccus sp. MC1865 TaxID=2760310 RepID=UPI0015FF26A4|nr:arginine repressor [Tessaracoccus sp. MC1865]MBB1484275.1 arginine repressor [Tessaracoccus sp. MC1865]QTO38606.1 arginine repressor [Tessaracoccus sp. MC1865]
MPKLTRAGRLATLRQLLVEARYTSQGELIDALAEHGIAVSQPTLSKDLLELGAVRQRAVGGALVYAPAGEEGEDAALEKLARLCAELLQSIRHAGTQILVRTPPGAAQYFASYLDLAGLPGVLGTIAGDDTVLVIATDTEAAIRTVGAVSEMTRTGKPAKEDL